MRSLIFLLYLIVFAAVGLYSFQNQRGTTVRFAVWTAVVAAAFLVLGVIQATHHGATLGWHRHRVRREAERADQREEESVALREENARLREEAHRSRTVGPAAPADEGEATPHGPGTARAADSPAGADEVETNPPRVRRWPLRRD
jgi:hypothetical protein